MKKLIAAIMVTLASGELFAENGGVYSFLTAGQLLQVCESSEPFQYGSCLNYLAGTVDTLNMLMDMGAVTDDAYCLPSNITQTQLRFVTIKHLKNNPELLNHIAADQVAMALDEAFPCNK